MKSRPKNRGLMYERRSDDNQGASFKQQYDWAKAESQVLGVPFRGTYEDVEEMVRKRLHHKADIYLDNAISGGDLTRPGFRKFLRDAIADPTVSHVYVFKRDRLGRPRQSYCQELCLEVLDQAAFCRTPSVKTFPSRTRTIW